MRTYVGDGEEYGQPEQRDRDGESEAVLQGERQAVVGAVAHAKQEVHRRHEGQHGGLAARKIRRTLVAPIRALHHGHNRDCIRDA